MTDGKHNKKIVNGKKSVFILYFNISLFKYIKIKKKKLILSLKEKIEGHVDKIYEFLRTFGAFKEIREEVEMGDKRYKIYQSIENYMEIVKENILSDTYYKKCSNDVINEALEEIENYITQRLNIM